MRWTIVLILLAGCAQTTQERLNELSADGVHLYRQGEYAHAQETFRAALVLRPNDPGLLYNLGRCHEKMGNQEAADKVYQECLQYDPDHPAARHAVVARLVALHKHDDAVRHVSAWLRSSPKLAAPYVEDGWLYAQERDFDSAKGRFQQALALDPRNARALAELANVCKEIDRPDRALVLYERSLEANPDQPEVRVILAKLRKDKVSPPHPD